MFRFAKEKKSNILPLADVEFRAWPEQNFLFGVLSEQDTGWDWVLNQFIQVRGAHYVDYSFDVSETSVTFYPYAIHQLAPNIFDLCPFLQKYTIPRQMIKVNYGKFHEFIHIAINAGFYISTFLDQFFRDDMKGNYGFHHPNFIYGYDDKKRVVYVADNFEKGIYGKKTISYEQVDRAFELIPKECWEISVFLYEPKEYKHTFQAQYVKEQLIDYLYPERGICYFNRTVCTTSSFRNEKYKNEVFMGINCYELMLQHLQGILQNDKEYMDNDIRSFVMLCDHKKLMIQRYEYMSQKGYLVKDEKLYEALKSLEKECLIVQNMFLKYKITQDLEYVKRIQKRLKIIRKVEQNALESFAEKIM